MEDFDRTIALLRKRQILFEENVSLSRYVSFRIGGPCKILVKPKNFTEFSAASEIADKTGIDRFILGNGTNLLVADEGYSGMVILTSGLSHLQMESGSVISCDAGVLLSKLCLFALEHSLSGLEFAYGIPGSVGGAIYMNAGAYGGEIKDVLASAKFLDDNHCTKTLSTNELEFSYRKSRFCGRKDMILCGTFSLKADDKAAIKARMDDFLCRRKTKQPLEFPSAGSAFKRPQGSYASALIEQCGLKGYSVGGAQVSKKHSGFIINTGNATCQDVRALISYIQQTVFEKTGYHLEPEIKTLGF